MKDLREELTEFLLYVNDNCTDSYGQLQVMALDNENLKKDYADQTPEGIVETYLSLTKRT